MFECELKFCVRQEFEKTFFIKPHNHPCYELVYYEEGAGIVEIDGVEFPFKKDTFCLIPPEQVHRENYSENVKVLYIGFDIFNIPAPLQKGLYTNELYPIHSVMEEIFSEMQEKAEYRTRMLNLLTEKITIMLIRKAKFDNKDEEKLSYILNFIKINCMKNIDVADIAEAFHYNYDYFRRMFKRKMKISVKDYIAREKLHYALSLMQNTDYSIKKIALSSGYSSPSHFGVLFKQSFGATPNEYMNLLKQKDPLHEVSNYDVE